MKTNDKGKEWTLTTAANIGTARTGGDHQMIVERTIRPFKLWGSKHSARREEPAQCFKPADIP